MSLNLYQRVTQSEAHLSLDLEPIARNYRRVSRSIGGWYSGGFYVSPEDAGRTALQTFYNAWIGNVVRETAYGMLAWEGIVYAMQLTLGGAIYEISLDPDRWHNNVIVYFSDLAVVDTNQGALTYPSVDSEVGALSYTTEGADETFTDAGQDFSTYSSPTTTGGYQIDVVNTDGTVTWGYLGLQVANTEIRVYSDVGRSATGWNGQNPAGLTPLLYRVRILGSFNDAGQDFSDWETLVGDAAYRLVVANSDNTTSWGYIGESAGATACYVYTNAGRTIRGWNGEFPAMKTPTSYEVVEIARYGVRDDTGWASNAESVSEYGEMEYAVTLPGSMITPATALRDRLLTEGAWPRSRFVGTTDAEDSLAVTLAGFWGTSFWRYWEHSQTAVASTLMTNLATDAQFIGAGHIVPNTLSLTSDAFPIPQRIGDLILRVQEMGDAAGNVWNCGVYENRDLVYEAAPTTAEFLWRGGRLLNKAGQPVQPELVRPGFFLRAQNILGAVQPPGASGVWDDPNVAFVDEVEWARDDGVLTLSLKNSSLSLMMRQQIVGGVA